MNPAVVEVGPQTVRGPECAPREWISVAIECVDDHLALLDDRLIEVRRLWSNLLEVVAGERAEPLVLVVPTWWSSARVELITDAAGSVAPYVVVLQRGSALNADGATTVVELSDEFVVIVAPGVDAQVLPRGTCDVAAHLGAASEVLIDVPAEVSPPTPALATRLRAVGIAVAYSDRCRMVRSVSAGLGDRALRESAAGRARSRRVIAVLAGAMVTLAAVGGGWAAQRPAGQPLGDSSTELLLEGRVAVRVPARWVVERITSGPGSARLRVTAPTGDSTALHLTQSAGATSATLAEVAETLRRALESEPPGVFTDMDSAGSVGGRPAVTYRELRAGSETSWAVVIDGAILVAIGCQSPPGRPEVIHDACVRAVQSAHVV
ncbi:type VII secretion-associated protein [Mycolicibacterium cyprinidarum]|uniref:Type VII secretion-associated protein n=1 Tax=Mycolicibacterium cyprinidarum TaxID=2860311 RepID=A0ABQ4V4I3_9MYCO|nr:type VII secretion-associated protein [Mycolicibacterium sp. NGTWSNA01]GJF12203.1 type VII secretion-associated protein [Mycolicibacterium sp. NGTWS0302]